MAIKNVRKIAVATTLLASLGGGAVAANAAGIGPMGATVHSSTWYADNAVRAWGAGNASQASKYLTGGTQRALFGWKSVGGGDWSRTGYYTRGNITYVSYKNRAGSTVTLQVNNANRKKTTRVINYVNWTIGNGYGTTTTKKAPVTTNTTRPSTWVATTNGYGPITIGMRSAPAINSGVIRDLTSCKTIGKAYGSEIYMVGGRVTGILLGSGARTSSGIGIGDSQARLKRVYGNQIRLLGGSDGNRFVYQLKGSNGHAVIFTVTSSRVSDIYISDGVHDMSDSEGC